MKKKKHLLNNSIEQSGLRDNQDLYTFTANNTISIQANQTE